MNLHDNVRWIKTWLYIFFSSAVVRLHFAFQPVKETITSTSALSTGRCENRFLLIFMTKVPLRSTVTHQCVHLTQYGLCTVLLLCPNTLLMFVISVHSAVCVCVCVCFAPLHLSDELLPGNVNCDFSDRHFCPLLVLSAC